MPVHHKIYGSTCGSYLLIYIELNPSVGSGAGKVEDARIVGAIDSSCLQGGRGHTVHLNKQKQKKVRKRRGFSVQSAQNLLSAFFATNLMHA